MRTLHRNPRTHACQAQRLGFSLTELLVTLAIAAILATIALPSFQANIRQGRRTDGHAALMEIAIAQAKYRANCTRYASHLSGSPVCDPTKTVYALGMQATSAKGHYRLSIAAADANGFVAAATPLGDQSQDNARGVACTPLTIDQEGNRGPAPCW